MRVYKLKKIVLLIAGVFLLYSFLPIIPFLFMEEADIGDNNITNVKELEQNEGVYFSFIVMGDNHAGLLFNDVSTIKEIWHMNREDRFQKVPIDFVLNVGDVTLDGHKRHYQASKKIQKLIKYPFVTAIGNHDDRELFDEYYGKKEFSFVNRNSYFIIMDNERGKLYDYQFEWLEKELKKGREYDNIFIAMHKPPYDPYQQEWYNMDNQPWAYRFRKMCAEYDVDMVFTGHKHMFQEEEFDGVKYIVTGGGGMLIEIPEADGGYLHYVRVMVNQDYVTYEVREISPPLWLQITYYFAKEAVYWFRNLYGSGYIFGRNTEMQPLREDRVNDREYWIE